jgi:hypothetical protein
MTDKVMYQFKVKLDNEKCRVFFLEPDEVDSFDYSSLVNKIRSFSSQFRSVRKDQLRLYYLDDENTFVHLSDDASAVVEMYRCSVAVENADFKRITIKVEESSSPDCTSAPSTRCGKRPVPNRDVDTSPSSLPSKREKERKSMKSNAVRSLCTKFDVGESSKSHVDTPKTAEIIGGKLFQSPLEKYLEKQRDSIRNVKEKEKRVMGTLQEYQSAIKKKVGYVDGPMCGNCHQREGHNKLNCPYQKCETVFLCGDIAKHPEEKTRMKQVEKNHRELLKEMSTLENDFKVKEASATSLQSRYVYKVRNVLIESNPSRYLSVGAGGVYVENWFQLNKDARKLQSILKGKVPTSVTNIQKLLDESTDDTLNTSVIDKGKTTVRNPYRNIWEQKGVQWPGRKESSTSVSTCSQSSSSSLPSDDDTFPNIDEQPSLLSDDYVLALGIKESLKNVEANPAQIDQEIEGNPADTGVGLEENPFEDEIDRELEVSNNIPVLDQRFANVGISHDSYVGGLNTLADVCDRLYAEGEILDDLI